MKSTARIIGWICFGIASAIYLIATCYFGVSFASVIADYKSGETVGFGALLFIFLAVGSIIYLVAAVVALIGAIVGNVNRGGKKFFFAPIITLALTVLTWAAFSMTGMFL